MSTAKPTASELKLAAYMMLGAIIGKPEAAEPVKETQTSATWAARHDLYILDADGWDRRSPADFDRSWNARITEAEFLRRAAMSTTAKRSDLNLRNDNS